MIPPAPPPRDPFASEDTGRFQALPPTTATLALLARSMSRTDDPEQLKAIAGQMIMLAEKTTPRPVPVPFADRLVAVLPDVVAILVLGGLAFAKVLPAEVAAPIMTTVIAGRLYPRKPPPGSAPNGGTPPSGLLTLSLAVFAGFRSLAHFLSRDPPPHT